MISPELQHADLDRYLARMSQQTGRLWRAVVVEQDLDMSGRSFKRAGVQRLLELIRQGAITTILVYKYDRLGRNAKEALQFVEEVEALGGLVVSVTEPLDASSALGGFMRTQVFAFAEMYSQQISESWKRVHQHRLAQGLPTNGRERYGYLAHRTTLQRGDGAWRICPQGCEAGTCTTGFVPDPETAPVVQRIYTEYVTGRGFQRIAHGLNADAISTPGQVAARRSGNPIRISRTLTTRWQAGTVIDVSDTGFAAGLISHLNEWSPGAHEPLINEQEWAAYQRRRDSQRQMPSKARSPHWALAGIAVCGGCGGPMYCSSSQRGPNYALYCGTQRTSGECKGTYRTRAPVEAAVALWLGGYAAELEAATRSALKTLPTPKGDPTVSERRQHLKTIEKADGKFSRLLDLFTDDDGDLDLVEYKRRRAEIQNAVQQAQERLAQLDEPRPTAPTATVVSQFADTWPSLDVDARRDIAKALLEKVRVLPDKTVELIPRWSPPVLVTFTCRGRTPHFLLPPTSMKSE